jgi:hypothetical protein
MFKQDKPVQFSALFVFFAFLAYIVSTGCTNRNKQDIMTISVCDTSVTTYSATVSNIITTKCNDQSGCHGSISPASASLLTYQNVKDRIGDILVQIKNGSMPKNNSKLDDCSILKIETWANKGALNN